MQNRAALLTPAGHNHPFEVFASRQLGRPLRVVVAVYDRLPNNCFIQRYVI